MQQRIVMVFRFGIRDGNGEHRTSAACGGEQPHATAASRRRMSGARHPDMQCRVLHTLPRRCVAMRSLACSEAARRDTLPEHWVGRRWSAVRSEGGKACALLISRRARNYFCSRSFRALIASCSALHRIAEKARRSSTSSRSFAICARSVTTSASNAAIWSSNAAIWSSMGGFWSELMLDWGYLRRSVRWAP